MAFQRLLRSVGLAWAIVLSIALNVLGQTDAMPDHDIAISSISAAESGRHAVPRSHPRLLGSRERLQQLAREQPQAYERVVNVARSEEADPHAKIMSRALVSAIEQDEDLGRRAIDMALRIIRGPIRRGHVTFGHDLAQCAIAFDLCYEYWAEGERKEFYTYMNQTVDANVDSETHVFHNAWYGYKNWGIGLACYATFYENPRAVGILRTLEKDYMTRAAPALTLAGAGGGWAEGYYINYWLYEWLFFCEAARWCEGVDYYAAAPGFYQSRAIASMFESYPGIGIYNSRRSIPIGDGGGRTFGGDRDKTLAARRILVNYFRDDQAHQAVHTFDEQTPRSSVGVNAYKDLLWHDPSVARADLGKFRLSHISRGPGYVYARSSWPGGAADDATYFFFKCGNRFTAHQHLDVGNFLIYKHEELVGDGGHYEEFGSRHDVNYHLRSIAHNVILVHDDSETWPSIRAGKVTGNDGGQAHNWPHHNGAVADPAAWEEDRKLYDIGTILAFEDQGTYLYVAGECGKAYEDRKMQQWLRQIVFLRPNTFVVFDRVVARAADQKKTWLLQAMQPPEKRPDHLVITNGQGRLFVQTLLPRQVELRQFSGDELYQYDGQSFPPQRDTGPAPACRIEISPVEPRQSDLFLHVLTTADAGVESVPVARVEEDDKAVQLHTDGTVISFVKSGSGGTISLDGQIHQLAHAVLGPGE